MTSLDQLEPWKPGVWGKGLVVGDQIHHWKVGGKSLNGYGPHHREVAVNSGMMDNEGFFGGLDSNHVRLLHITPEGRATDCLRGDKLPDWVHDQIGSIQAEPDPRWKFTGLYDSEQDLYTPFIHDPVTNQIHYGEPDGIHGEIIRDHYRATGERLRGTHGVVSPSAQRIHIYGTPTPDPKIIDMVKNHYGFDQVKPETRWEFNAGVEDDPYYNPEFDDPDDDDDKMADEVLRRMENPPSDKEILELVKKGVPLGVPGKMLRFDDGTEAKWVPDEYGSPHHNDVTKALGKHRVDRKYLHVDTDGTVYDLAEMPPVNNWTF